MKHIKYLLGGILTTALFLGSCSDKETIVCPENPMKSENNIKFYGAISKLQTRATDTKWDSGDAIGVYTIKNGSTLSNGIYEGKSNIKYTTPATGVFTVADPANAIKITEANSLDFIAYYPYNENLTDNKIKIDITKKGADILHSNNSKNNQGKADVNLIFKHVLTKVVFTVNTANDTSLEGLKVNFKDQVLTTGELNLETGAVTTGTKTAFVPMQINLSTDKKTATVSAILMPTQNLEDLKLDIELNGNTYELKKELATGKMEGSKKYSYKFTLTPDGSVIVKDLNGTIEDWTEGNTTGTGIVLKPNKKNTTNTSNTNTGNTTDPNTNTGNTGGTTPTPDPNAGTTTPTPDPNTNTAGTTPTPTPDPNTKNLAPGTDFEDWTAFEGTLNKYGANKIVTQSNDGKNGKALSINGNLSSNAYLFTIENKNNQNLAGKKAITFYIKGTATGKSLSFNIYKSSEHDYKGKMYQDYETFNLGVIDGSSPEITITPKPKNAYTGSIDTQGKWLKVTLDISAMSDLDVANGKTLLALKVGKQADYNLLIDDIKVE